MVSTGLPSLAVASAYVAPAGLQSHSPPPVSAVHVAIPGATSIRALVKGPQPLMAMNSPVGSSPMPTPEPLLLQSCDTSTSPVSAASLPSAQPGSSRSVCPSASSSAPFAHGLPPPVFGGGVG